MKTIGKHKLYNGDCLKVMKKIPDNSVDLVLCDLPYGTVKGIGAGTTHGMAGKVDWDTTLNLSDLFSEYDRCCRQNAMIVLFCQDPFTYQLMQASTDSIGFCYRMTWLKDHFANALIAKKAPVNYTEDILCFKKRYDTNNMCQNRKYAKLLISESGNTKKELVARFGQALDHFCRTDSLQFSLPNKIAYTRFCEHFGFTRRKYYVDYESLCARQQKPIFNLDSGSKVKSNVLQYKKDYDGFHPTQKPVALLEDLIRTYSNEGMTVLDNTAGSGSTIVACVNTQRIGIGIEKDPTYYNTMKKRVREAHKNRPRTKAKSKPKRT
jgi:site-specific DNA-methyltransferase (adenine-specific)